ncbi:FYVE, RhoGEF and PH domain-containing protein 5 [Perognathus longimembris pacificus]|uniref:FYVE, RhoGEF and PH domain-containing protein 5 n=1 Tax=Perognathus longimembris pacificus TaxID=214514 RepID=UPI0020194425|nr:FYVE, RhoGEF and PH domain-containing protein 5 [Perognathus longimembris pacificus]
MNRADSPKPPVAPKPKTAGPRTPVTVPAFPAFPRPEGPGSPNSMSRGPKPPIAPKPRLAAPGEGRVGVHTNSTLPQCSNGRLLCGGPRAECSESETDEDYIMLPGAREGAGRDSEGPAARGPPEAPGDEEDQQAEAGGPGRGTEETGAEGGPAVEALGREGAEDAGQVVPERGGHGGEHGGEEEGEEGEEVCGEYDLEEGEEGFRSKLILTPIHTEVPGGSREELGSPEVPRDAEEDGEEGRVDTEPGGPGGGVDSNSSTQDTGQDVGEACEEPPEEEEEPPEEEEESPEEEEPTKVEEEPPEEEEETPREEEPLREEESPEEEERSPPRKSWPPTPWRQGRPPLPSDPLREMVRTPQAVGTRPTGRNRLPTTRETSREDAAAAPRGAEGGDPPQEDPSEDSCHIILFESDSAEDLAASLAAGPYRLFPAESTSFCGQGDPVSQPAPATPGAGAPRGSPAPRVVVLEEEDAADGSLSNPYVTCLADPAGAPGGDAGPEDRKHAAARARPHSGKVAGHVPETVLEEVGPGGGGPREVPPPAKPRAFTLYPRSFSVEGREPPPSLYREPVGPGLEELRVRRKEDNLSLPCVIGSSGSFSQRNHLPSSGTSTPSSVADIPPPFDLACVTKRPITKSSPSLLTGGDSPDKGAKKKKSSFKRFLALTFRKKTESKGHGEAHASSSRSSSESSYHGPARILEMDRRSLSSSPQLTSRAGKLRASESPSSFVFLKDGKRRGAPCGRTVSRVESFEDRSRPPFLPLPLTKPRSISFPNADTSDYENIPAVNSDYENIQIPPRRPARPGTFTKLFQDQSRALATANENDGYVDMSSFNAFESKQQSPEQEAESAYTEPYKVCPISVSPGDDVTSEEEQGSSEEDDGTPRDPSLTPKVEGQSRALVIAQELLSSEKAYVQMLQPLGLDFHAAVTRALDEADPGGDAPAREELRRGLSALPAILDLHRGILEDLEQRLRDWEAQQKVADVFLAREAGFEHHATHVVRFDRYLGLLAEDCLRSPPLATAVREFERGALGGGWSVKHQLLRVVQRLFQYQVLLTDYLNNLCPDSAEYDSTQDALSLISKVTDQANDSMEQGENLQKLVHIEHSVRGQGDLLQPGREFLKEGTLMKVRGKDRHPRHLFLMSDVLLYTSPQKDGKYRLKSTLPVASMKVSRPVMERVPYALKIETPESCLTLSASSCAERDEWHRCLSRVLPEDYKAQALAAFQHSVEIRERLGVSLGERPPTLVPVTHVMMCMNCGCDFSLTLRRHHCHACGKIVCRNCSRNKYPLKYLKDRMAKVCDGCFGELKKRGGAVLGPMRERPVSMSFPLSSPRLSSVFQSLSPSTFKKQKKVPSALAEVSASGEGAAISGYLSRCRRGKRPWKKLWFVIKGKVLYTYMACEDKVALESMPLLGFTIAPEKEGGEGGTAFHLYHKKSLFYSFRAEDSGSARRWMAAMEDASVL